MDDQTLLFDFSNSPTGSTPESSSGKTSQASSPCKTTRSAVSLQDWLERMPHSFRQKNQEDDGQTRVWLLDPGAPQLGVSSTLNISEWPNDANVCSLSQVLEPSVHSKYFLSPRACAGILRRAANRGKDLPPMLLRALQAVAGALIDPAKAADKTPSSPSTDAPNAESNASMTTTPSGVTDAGNSGPKATDGSLKLSEATTPEDPSK